MLQQLFLSYKCLKVFQQLASVIYSRSTCSEYRWQLTCRLAKSTAKQILIK